MIQPSLRPQLGLLAKTPKCDLSMSFCSVWWPGFKSKHWVSYRYILKRDRKRRREWISMSNISPLMTPASSFIALFTSTANPLSCWVWPSYKEATYSVPDGRTQAFLEENRGMRRNSVAFFGKYKSPCHIAMCFLDTTARFHDSCDFLFVQ